MCHMDSFTHNILFVRLLVYNTALLRSMFCLRDFTLCFLAPLVSLYCRASSFQSKFCSLLIHRCHLVGGGHNNFWLLVVKG